MKEDDGKQLELVASILIAVKDIATMKLLLVDLCTRAEIRDFSERLTIASKLLEKKSYRTIAEETGASTTTITRVAHWLHYGKGGYELVLGKKE